MATANFESRISGNSYSSKSISSEYDMSESLAGFSNNYSVMRSVGDIFEELIELFTILLSIGLGIFCFFFFIYIFISLFSKGGEKTLGEIKLLGTWIRTILSGLFQFIKNIFTGIIHFIKTKKLISAIIILILVGLNFVGDVVNGNSKILKLSQIHSGYVGVDLKNDKILNPGYHLYSPIKSSFFLSPTNNFDFDIVDVKADSKEELAVSLDYRVTFKILDDKRLKLYRENGSKNIRLVSSDIVMPRILEVINGIIKNYSFKDISSKHSEIKGLTITEANKVLSTIGIEIGDLNILAIKLPDSYVKSKQDLLKAENELKLAESRLESQKKESERKLLEATNSKNVKIIQAEAEAEYNKIINSEELTPRMVEIKKLEIEELKIKKWDGKLPSTTGEGFSL